MRGKEVGEGEREKSKGFLRLAQRIFALYIFLFSSLYQRLGGEASLSFYGFVDRGERW